MTQFRFYFHFTQNVVLHHSYYYNKNETQMVHKNKAILRMSGNHRYSKQDQIGANLNDFDSEH